MSCGTGQPMRHTRGMKVKMHAKALLWASVLVLLAACGGGGGGGSASSSTPPPVDTGTPLGPGESAFTDTLAYSTAAKASLAAAADGAAVTRHTIMVSGKSLAYTATAGHLIATAQGTAAPEASMFYVAYTLDGADATTRPVTFFYNGGPGSATAWLHLGSFGPRRLATGIPATTAATPFPLVDNADSLLDTSDLVFVDAVGTGLSQAIAPNSNQSFWGVDADAGVMRDFVMRWLAVNHRAASPLFLYGESYGGPRTAVLARALQAAGVQLTGLVLQSPALDYNSNCGVTGQGSCGANLPSYAAVGSWHQLTTPAQADLPAYMVQMRSFSDQNYGPAVAAFLGGAAVPADQPPLLAAYTGIPAATWSSHFNLSIGDFQTLLLPGRITGLYDGRMTAAVGSALASQGDPSSTFLNSSFSTRIGSYLQGELRYTNASTYVLLSGAINTWDFRHAGRALPDTVPDLAAVLASDPRLAIHVISGYHDLVTPFHVTETDLARLGSPARVQVHNYNGGHMSYLDDGTRPVQKADLVAWYAQRLAARAAPSAEGPSARALAATPHQAALRVGAVPSQPQPAMAQAALQVPMRDPWVPPGKRP